MAKRVTNEDILVFNEIYYKTKNYTQVARETGFSASTVRKYIDKNWQPVASENIIRFDITQLPDFTEAAKIFRDVDNYGYLCQLTPMETEEIKELWKELAI
jgi:hypothetical protein